MIQQKVIVLGAGLIGKAIAVDLSKKYDVACADKQMCSLEVLSPKYNITVIPSDFSDKDTLKNLIAPFDLVIGAVPGFMGFETLQTIVECGKNVVDISFFPEDAFLLDELAKKNNVIAVTDCGVAPGLCNIMAGHHHKVLKLLKYECLVGGLPVVREWPFDYKAVFSPIDVIEEYTRPARFVENGKQVIKEALSDVQKVTFDVVGELEAFNSDGLRSLAQTMRDIPNMKEKTLRYPGHAELMRIFRETGFFNKEKISIAGKNISPLDLTSKLFFEKWKLKPGEEEFTIMSVTMESETGKIVYTLLDRFDKTTNTTSMARTTGYTCTAVADLILNGNFRRKGISPPEFVGEADGCFQQVIKYLEARNVFCKKQVIKKKELAA